MSKSYAIIHDGTHVLICQGGKRGNPPRERLGYHLPGGTDKGDRLKSLEREILEETGLTMPLQPAAPFTVPDEPDMKHHDFYIYKVPSLSALLDTAGTPKGNDPYDEPFKTAEALPIEDVLKSDQFKEEYQTDWFGKALAYASKQKLLS